MKKILIFLVFLILNTNTYASEKDNNFSKSAFLNAQKEGKIVVVKSNNKYCFTCIQQSKVFSEAKIDFQDIIFLSFAQKNKEIAELFNITKRSTIVIYKNNVEIARSIGQTNKSQIYSFIKDNT